MENDEHDPTIEELNAQIATEDHREKKPPHGLTRRQNLIAGFWNVADRFTAQRTSYVYQIGPGSDIRVYRANEEDRVVKAWRRRRTWLKENVQPRRIGNRFVFFAVGPEIIPWPNDLTYWDQPDDDPESKRVPITPEYLDSLLQTKDTEAWLRGVKGMSLGDRLLHLAAGATIGAVITYAGLKLLGFGASAIQTAPALVGGGAP